MNKVFLGLILAVCILGMALVMLNDRLGRKPEPRPVASAVEAPLPAPPASPAEIEAEARAREIAEAAQALAAGPQKPGQSLPEPEIKPQPVLPAVKPPLPPRAVAEAPEPVKPVAKPPMSADRQPTPAMRPEPKVEQAPKPQAPEVKPAAQEPKPAAANQTGKGNSVNRFVIYARDKGATVRIGGNGKLDYSSMTLANPDRIVVDLPGEWKFPPNPGVPKNDLVSAVRVGQQGDKTRVVIDLKQTARKVVLVPFKNGDGVDVRVDK